MAETYTGITPADVTGYRDRLNKLLGTDQISGVWTPPTSPLSYKTTTPAVVPPTIATPAVVTPPVATPSVPIMQGAVNASKGGYIIKAGDTLGQIASGLGMTVAELAHINQIADPNKIQVGQVLITPAPAGAPAGSTPAVATPPVSTVKPIATTPTKTVTAPTITTPKITPPAGAGAPTLTSDQIATKQAESAGMAGLSLDEWTKTQMPTVEESAKIAKDLGIPQLEGEVFKKPSLSSQQVYDQAYATSGLGDIKAKILAINDEITKSRASLTDAIGKIDENPFLTETSRVGRGKRAMTQAEAQITNQLDLVKRLQDIYTNGVSEINGIVTRNTNDFGVNQKIDEAQLNYLQKKAETQTAGLQVGKVSANIGTFLKSKVGSEKPTTIGSEDMGYYKWDPTLKKFIQVIPASGMAGLEAGNKMLQNQKLQAEIKNLNNGGAGGTFTPTADQKSLVGRFVNSSMSKDLGFSAEDKARLATDSNFFYWALQKATEAGMY